MVFKIADDNGLLLLDLKDLRAMLQYVGENAKSFTTEYGNVSSASIGAIQRNLLAAGDQGGDVFFGEPMLDIADLMQTTPTAGRGQHPRRGQADGELAQALRHLPPVDAVRAVRALPEVGDPEKPKLVFFFDEAHLLFDDAPKALVEKVEQVVRLIRSKGVGVYFITQNPIDVPGADPRPAGQPRAARAARLHPARPEGGVGEALVSLLDAKGRPSVTERVYVLPPGSRIGPIVEAERAALLQNSLVAGVYEKALDRQSAYEMLKGQAAAPSGKAGSGMADEGGAVFRQQPTSPQVEPEGGGVMDGLKDVLFGSTGPRGGRREGLAETAAKSALRSIGSSVGREIVRGVLGSLLGGGSSRRRR
jgi:DNA helicase HerA-like ATPase